jgi:predicted enzyme related to lactoylglutathione lyase
MAKKKIGKIVWHDLTGNDAVQIIDFYQQEIGWEKKV